MTQEWQTLTRLTEGASIVIERVRLTETGIAIEGPFEPPPLAQLTAEDQTFVAAFVRCHGSIKQMEKYFGVSYPTIKNRLNRIGEALPFIEIEAEADATPNPPDVLSALEQGTLSVEAVLEQLKRQGGAR
ncbi:MAG: DUF2089 domain-containing protein [Thermoanaerobaculia bacterium]